MDRDAWMPNLCFSLCVSYSCCSIAIGMDDWTTGTADHWH